MSNPITQIAISKFGEVARLAAIQELKIRLLANKTKAIEDSAYEFSVSETNKKVIEHFSKIKALTAENASLLEKSQTIRNKILHCEFNEAVKRIESLTGAKASGPSVKKVALPTDGAGIFKTILAAHEAIAKGKPGPYQDVSGMKDKDVGIFGGLLNCVQTGAMEMAIDIFKESNTVLDDLMKIETTFTAGNKE